MKTLKYFQNERTGQGFICFGTDRIGAYGIIERKDKYARVYSKLIGFDFVRDFETSDLYVYRECLALNKVLASENLSLSEALSPVVIEAYL